MVEQLGSGRLVSYTQKKQGIKRANICWVKKNSLLKFEYTGTSGCGLRS